MSLTGQPIYQKGQGAEKKRKGMRKISKKRAAYRASAEGKAGMEYMARVKEKPCCVCGAPPPSEAHHCRSGGMARDDFKTIPLCIPCHRGDKGYHLNKREWEEKNGPDYGFLEDETLKESGNV